MAIPWILEKSRTEQEIVDETNDLARIILAQAGYQVPDGHKFYEDADPRSKQSWQRACEIMEHMTATDPNDALANLDDDGMPVAGPTPGPWSVSNGRLIRVTNTSNSPVVICGVHRIGAKGGPKGGDPLANAYLLAAAPDMRDALAALLPEVDYEIETRQNSGNDEYWQPLKKLSDAGHAALSKSKGQVVGNPIREGLAHGAALSKALEG